MSNLDTRLAAYREQLTGPAAPTTERRWIRPAAAAALLVTVGVAAGGWAITRSGNLPAATATVATAAADPLPLPATTSRFTGPAAAAIPTTAPLTTWRNWQTRLADSALPSVEGEGPRNTLPNALSGYSRTPTGALLAAANIVMPLYYATDEADWEAVADTMAVWPSGTREDLANRRAESKIPAKPIPLSLVGFRYISYTPDEATVRLWWKGQSTLGLITRLVWVDGDWRVAWDENVADAKTLTAEDSYIPWAPRT